MLEFTNFLLDLGDLLCDQSDLLNLQSDQRLEEQIEDPEGNFFAQFALQFEPWYTNIIN